MEPDRRERTTDDGNTLYPAFSPEPRSAVRLRGRARANTERSQTECLTNPLNIPGHWANDERS